MAAVTVTPAEVLPITTGSNPTRIDNTRKWGATVVAGKSVYLDETDNKYKLADSNLSVAAAECKGIALNGGADGQPASVAIGGDIDPGFTVDPGEVYVVGATAAGDINPVADLTTGWRTGVIGLGIDASTLRLVLAMSGIAHS